MKILTDFDGVMTDQTEEAQFQRSVFAERLGGLDALANRAAQWVAKAADEVTRHAHVHGWWSQGRLAAYADEDSFVRLHAMAACLDQWSAHGDEALCAAREELRASGLGSFVELMAWSFRKLVAHTKAGGIRPMDPMVGETIDRLLTAGVEVVVVSNSPSSRIIQLLENVGLRPASHQAGGASPFRVRGRAGKFDLGTQPEVFEVDGRVFDTDRPSYRVILEEERPDVVVGDVFSLDLALPLYLSADGGGGLELLLRARDYTPAWARALCADGRSLRGARMGIMTRFEQLLDVAGAG